jgi:hypothetical protein
MTMNNLDNMASLTNDRIEQILLGNISSDNETRTKQRRVNMTSVFELWKYKRDQQSELPKKYKPGSKLSTHELRKASRKLYSIARDHFGHGINLPSTEFSHIALNRTIEFAKRRILRNPWLRYPTALCAAIFGAFQLENSGAPAIYAPLTAAGIALLAHTAYRHNAIKEGPYFEFASVRIHNQRREIAIPQLAYNIAQFLSPQQGPQHSAIKHGIARSFERHVAGQLAEEDNHNFLRKTLDTDIRELRQCDQWLTNGKSTTPETKGSVLLQLYEISGNPYEEILHGNSDIAGNLNPPKKKQKLRGKAYLYSIPSDPKQ